MKAERLAGHYGERIDPTDLRDYAKSRGWEQRKPGSTQRRWIMEHPDYGLVRTTSSSVRWRTSEGTRSMTIPGPVKSPSRSSLTTRSSRPEATCLPRITGKLGKLTVKAPRMCHSEGV
jgi:hypothetical protein